MVVNRVPYPSLKKKQDSNISRFNPKNIGVSRAYKAIKETCPDHNERFRDIRDISDYLGSLLEEILCSKRDIDKAIDKTDSVLTTIRYNFRYKLEEAWEKVIQAQAKANDIYEELKKEKEENKKLRARIKMLEKQLDKKNR